MDCKIITSQCDREGLGLLLLLFDLYAKLAPIMGLQHSCGSGLEAAGGHEPIGMGCLLGCKGHPAQIHKGTVNDLGLAELSTLPTAL